jgi:heme exporter protein D
VSAPISLLQKKRVWIPLSLFVVYTLFGFFVLPPILRRQIVNGIHQNMKREARLDRVRCNPLALSLTLEGFELRDPDGTPFVSWDRMFMGVQLSSLVRWAITLRDFRLDGPRLHVRLMADGKPNFDDLIPKDNGKPPRRRTPPSFRSSSTCATSPPFRARRATTKSPRWTPGRARGIGSAI